MVERVDVLTGGASSTYGADAVAGVVNFIMNTHFEGVRLDFDYGQNMYGQTNDFAQSALGAETSGAGEFYRRPEPRLVVHGRFELCRWQGQRHRLWHLPEHLTGRRQPARLCRLHAVSALRAEAGPALARSPAAVQTRAATGRFLLLGATANGGFATLVDSTVDKTTGLFRPYTPADSYNYGASATPSARLSATPPVRSSTTTSTRTSTCIRRRCMRAIPRPPSTVRAACSHCIGLDQLLQSAPDPVRTRGPVHPGAYRGQPGELRGTGDHITLYLAQAQRRERRPHDNYSSNSIREVIGVKGSINDSWTYDVYGQYGISSLARQ